jgi:hypothetical protein
MEKKKDCNCKAKKNANNLIKSIEEINKSSSVDYVRNRKLKKYIFDISKIILYTVGIFSSIILIIPFLIFLIFNKKQITIKLPRLKTN